MCNRILPTLIKLIELKFIQNLSSKAYFFIEFSIFIVFIILGFVFVSNKICIKYLITFFILSMLVFTITRLTRDPQELDSLFFGSTYYCNTIIFLFLLSVMSLFFRC